MHCCSAESWVNPHAKGAIIQERSKQTKTKTQKHAKTKISPQNMERSTIIQKRENL